MLNNKIILSQSLSGSQVNKTQENQEVLPISDIYKTNGTFIAIYFKQNLILYCGKLLFKCGKLLRQIMDYAEVGDVINTFYSFLSERGTQVDSFNSQFQHWFPRDCTQVSCFGPLRWNFFMNKLLNNLSKLGILMKTWFCHCLCWWFGFHNKRRYKKAVGKWRPRSIADSPILGKWIQDTDFGENTKAFTFAKPKVQKRSPIYKLKNATIKTVYHFSYFDVVLDRTLNFVQHLKQKRSKTETVT